jgi:hypothetical protein
MPAERSFEFHGRATAISGFIGDDAIQSPVVCTIPAIGGESRTRASDLEFRNFLSIRSASASGYGRVNKEENWQSDLGVTIEGCNIFDVVHVEKIILRLESLHYHDGEKPLRDALGTRFEGLSIAGTPVRVLLDFTLGADGRRRVPDSLVVGIEPEPPGCRVDGNTIFIPGFGKIRLADAALTAEQMRVTMLTAEIEGPFPARIALASGTLNGQMATKEEHRAERNLDDATLRMGEEELEKVVLELRLWSNTHPAPTEPFLFFMGRTLTPVEFFAEVEKQSQIGVVFLNILVEESERSGKRPRDFIAKATEANRPE